MKIDLNIEIINKQKLSKDIYNHLVPAISRMSMKLNIRNPLLENIRNSIVKFIILVKMLVKILKKITNISTNYLNLTGIYNDISKIALFVVLFL